MPRNCKQCGKTYEPASNRQKYCSRSCVYRSRIKYLDGWIRNNPEHRLFKGARYRSKKKNIDFDLELEDIVIPEKCPVLGIDLFATKNGKSGLFPNSPSLDRIDPDKGYTKDNVRVISCRANHLKSNASVEEVEKVLLDLKALRARCD